MGDVGGMGEWRGSIKFWCGPKKKNGVGRMDRNFGVAGVGPQTLGVGQKKALVDVRQNIGMGG